MRTIFLSYMALARIERSMSASTAMGDSTYENGVGTPGLKEQKGAVAERAKEAAEEVHEMGQMGAKRIGSLAIGIGVVGIVLNKMSTLDVVNNSSGVIDVSNIFQVAGSGLNLLVVGVIIAAAAVLLNLWSGF